MEGVAGAGYAQDGRIMSESELQRQMKAIPFETNLDEREQRRPSFSGLIAPF
jgi:hypothetical protein